MSSALLLSGILVSAAVRRTRKADGAIFAVARIRDTDRGAPRVWTVFINNPRLIEQFEDVRVGEPVAVTGPFSFAIAGNERETTIEHRISVEALLDTKRRKKSKGTIAKEQRIASDELNIAPVAEGPSDAIPF